MEDVRSKLIKRLGIAATLVSLTGGTIALWDKLKPEEEIPDLTGRWIITNTVTGSDGDRYNGEVYVYSVGVTQDAAAHLKGKGEQTHYNGRSAPSRFPIEITDGKVKANKTSVNFTIIGNREFTGTMWLTVDASDPMHLTGNFEYTAGITQGTTDVRIK